jgi:uncharacterized protein YxjI
MHPSLSNNLFLVKEHVGMFKAANEYDIYDTDSGRIILECREPSLGFITKMLRFTKYKKHTPFDIIIRTPEGEPLIRVERSIAIFLSKVSVFDSEDTPVGGFQQKFFSIGGKFDVKNSQGETVCSLKGNMVGWNFKFLVEGNEIATVSKKWSGIGKEFFTSADNYILQISDQIPADAPVRQLILAAVMCIDMVLKEE